MARPRDLTPAEELPDRRALMDCRTGLEVFGDHDLAKHAIKLIDAALKIYDKEVHAFVKDRETTAASATAHPPPSPTTLKATEAQLRDTSSIVERLLKKAGLQEKVKDVHAEHSGAIAVALALADLCKDVKEPTTVSAGEMLKKEANACKKLKDRLEKGGHAVFDDHVVKAVKEVWLALDEAYDILGIVLRRSGRLYDTIYSGRPTTKTALRPQLLLKDPSLPVPVTPKKPKTAGKGKSKAEDKTKDSEKAPKNNSGTDKTTGDSAVQGGGDNSGVNSGPQK